MTLKEFREKTKHLPENLELFMAERKTEFTYGLVNSAYVKEINFKEDPDGEVLATDKVLILDEE